MNNVIDDPDYADDRQQMARLKVRLQQWMVETNDPALRMYRWREREAIG